MFDLKLCSLALQTILRPEDSRPVLSSYNQKPYPILQNLGDQRIDSSLSRKFTLDLSSKLIYSAGNVVTALVGIAVALLVSLVN
jgi:hypothetical protein